MQGNPGQSWILHSTSCTPDSRCWILVFVTDTWILYSRLKWDFRYLLSCNCNSWIPKPRILDSTSENISRIPKSGFLALRRPSGRFWYWVVTQFTMLFRMAWNEDSVLLCWHPFCINASFCHQFFFIFMQKSCLNSVESKMTIHCYAKRNE